MPGPADFHPTVADARLAAAGVVDAATALDAAVDVLDAYATAGETPIRGFLCARECPATRLPRGGRGASYVLADLPGRPQAILASLCSDI
jgi:hypothetical protein